MDILETVAALDLKVAKCRQLMESMKVSQSFKAKALLTLTGHLDIKIKIMVFSEITGFGSYCSRRPEIWQMHTTYGVNKGVRVFKVM